MKSDGAKNLKLQKAGLFEVLQQGLVHGLLLNTEAPFATGGEGVVFYTCL